MLDHKRIDERAHAILENAGKPDGAHDGHWRQARREIEAEDSAVTPDRTAAAIDMPVEGDGSPHLPDTER